MDLTCRGGRPSLLDDPPAVAQRQLRSYLDEISRTDISRVGFEYPDISRVGFEYPDGIAVVLITALGPSIADWQRRSTIMGMPIVAYICV